MFRRITVGLKGGMLPVVSVAERLLKLGGCAPDCGLATPRTLGPFEKGLRMKLSMGADEGSPTEIHPSHPVNLGWDGRGIPPSCFPPRRARPIAPHWRTRSTKRAGDRKADIFAKTSFSAHLT